MGTDVQTPTRAKRTPCGSLPTRLEVLYVTSTRRPAARLAEAFAADSACQIVLTEVTDAAAGLEQLRERIFDAVLVHHDAGELDALELTGAIRAGGADEALVILGEEPEEELFVPCFELCADAYLCVAAATTRRVLWTIARAVQWRRIQSEHRRLEEQDRQRRTQEQREVEQLIDQQRSLVAAMRFVAPLPSSTAAEETPLAPSESLLVQYRELLRTQVIMGSGHLSEELDTIVEELAQARRSASQALALHVGVLESLVMRLAERYRNRE